MNIINKSARLIDFSWNKKKYRLKPAGKAVPVPDDAKNSAFLKALIEDGSVKEVKELTEEEKAANRLESLRDQATMLKIEFDDEWTTKDLEDEIELVEQNNKEVAELNDLRAKAGLLGIEIKDGWDAKKLRKEIEKKEK
jgi:hypothetical protein